MLSPVALYSILASLYLFCSFMWLLIWLVKRRLKINLVIACHFFVDFCIMAIAACIQNIDRDSQTYHVLRDVILDIRLGVLVLLLLLGYFQWRRLREQP